MLRRVRRIRQRIRKHRIMPHAWLHTHSFACATCRDGGVCSVALEVWRYRREQEEHFRHLLAQVQRRREADPEYQRVSAMFERARLARAAQPVQSFFFKLR
jgi:hypothetical protein